jgi:hypothetical protein
MGRVLAWFRARDVLLLLIGLLIGAVFSWAVSAYYYRQASREAAEQEDLNHARHVVVAMAAQHPIRDSQDFEKRVAAYLEALRRGRADGRGVPVYRSDGSIGVLFSVELSDRLKLRERLWLSEPK